MDYYYFFEKKKKFLNLSEFKLILLSYVIK